MISPQQLAARSNAAQSNTTRSCRQSHVLCVIAWIAINACAQTALGDWPYITTRDSFVFHADFPLDTNQKLVHELVSLRSELYRQLKLEPNRERIDVYLFGDKSVYELYMKRYFPSLKPRRAMFIKSNSPGNVFAYISPQFDVDLRHESTHSLLHASLPICLLYTSPSPRDS